MGIHVVQGSRVADGILDPTQPEALIYEPLPNGDFRLVGVEFIQLADDWAARNPNGGVPSLDGNLMNLVGAPEPLRFAGFLRAARLGLGRQSERQLLGLEQPCNL